MLFKKIFLKQLEISELFLNNVFTYNCVSHHHIKELVSVTEFARFANNNNR